MRKYILVFKGTFMHQNGITSGRVNMTKEEAISRYNQLTEGQKVDVKAYELTFAGLVPRSFQQILDIV